MNVIFHFCQIPTHTHTHTHTHKLTTQTLACIDETRANTHISCMHKCTHTHTQKELRTEKIPTHIHAHTHTQTQSHTHTHTHILSNSLSLCGNKIHTTALPLNVLCYRTQTHTNTHKHTQTHSQPTDKQPTSPVAPVILCTKTLGESSPRGPDY